MNNKTSQVNRFDHTTRDRFIDIDYIRNLVIAMYGKPPSRIIPKTVFGRSADYTATGAFFAQTLTIFNPNNDLTSSAISCAIITDLVITPYSGGLLGFTYAFTDSEGPNVTGYELNVYRIVDGSPVLYANIEGAVPTTGDMDLVDYGQYNVTVTTRCGELSSNLISSNFLTFSPALCVAVTSATLIANGDGLQGSWNADSLDCDWTGFFISLYKDGIGLADFNTSSSSFAYDTQEPGDYYYQVQTICGTDVSSFVSSNHVTITSAPVTCAVASNLVISSVIDGKINYSFDASAGPNLMYYVLNVYKMVSGSPVLHNSIPVTARTGQVDFDAYGEWYIDVVSICSGTNSAPLSSNHLNISAPACGVVSNLVLTHVSGLTYHYSFNAATTGSVSYYYINYNVDGVQDGHIDTSATSGNFTISHNGAVSIAMVTVCAGGGTSPIVISNTVPPIMGLRVAFDWSLWYGGNTVSLTNLTGFPGFTWPATVTTTPSTPYDHTFANALTPGTGLTIQLNLVGNTNANIGGPRPVQGNLRINGVDNYQSGFALSGNPFFIQWTGVTVPAGATVELLLSLA